MAKQYVSIVRLLDYLGVDQTGEINLPRLRKQLLAEFGMSQTGFIEVAGYTYTRQGVFAEADHPAFQERMKFHLLLWKCKSLLRLLENNEANLGELQQEFLLLSGDTDFDQFLSPYFAGPFNYVSRTAIAGKEFGNLGTLLGFEDFLQPEEREEAFRPLRIFLDEQLRLLRNVNKENYSIMRPQIEHWVKEPWHLYFNNLPHEFYDVKNDIVSLLINIGVAIQKSKKKDCLAISERLVEVTDLPSELRELILSNHYAYTGSGSSSGGWRNIGWVVWVIFMIAKAVSSDGCGSDTNYKSDYKYFENPPVYIMDSTGKKQFQFEPNDSRKRIDSLIKAIQEKKQGLK